MSFLDHFRRKSSAPDEATVRVAETPDPLAKKIVEAADAPAAPLTQSVRDAGDAGVARMAEEKSKSSAAVPTPPAAEETRIRFCVGDFLHRIPHHLLKQGPHDITFEVAFDAADVGDRIAHGHTTIPLVEVYRRAPHIFRKEIRESDNIEIRFPWRKLMSFIKPDNGNAQTQGTPQATAQTLATRVRSRMPDRVPPVPPPPSPSSAHTEGSSFAESARAAKLKGLRQPASWYTKPRPPQPAATENAVDPPRPATPSNASVPDAPVSPRPAPSTAIVDDPTASAAIPTISQSPTPIERAPEPEPLNPTTLSTAAQPLLDLGLAPETPTAPPSDRPREQPVETVELTLLKAEHTRQLHELARERDALAAQRSHLQNEVESLRNLAADFRTQIEEQKSSVAERQEEIVRAENIRNELQNQVDTRASDVSALQAEIEKLKAGKDEAVQTIAQERDALLQQKAYLCEQLAMVRQSRPGAAALGSATNSGDIAAIDSQVAGVQAERSKRAHQRQIEELQRRLTAFESSQKESAHELTREREARIKVERALAAAERARAEATALVENMRAETRRDLEAGLRKREAELARTQQELQEQLDAAIRTNEQAKAEKQQLLGQIQELQSAATSEREQLQARVAELAQTAGATGAAAPPVNDWESRAVASLESDVEGYRARIKALLQERETWNQERDQLNAKLAAQNDPRSAGSEAHSIVQELTMAGEKLRADLEAATEERNRLAEQLRTLEQRTQIPEQEKLDAARHDLETRLRSTAEERDRAQQSLAEAERTRNNRDAETARIFEELRHQLAAQEKTIGELRAGLAQQNESARTANETSLRMLEQSAREKVEESEKQIAALRGENALLTSRLQNTEAAANDERAILVQQMRELADEKRALEKRVEVVSAESQQAIAQIRRQRDLFEAEKDAARAALVIAEATHKAESASFVREHQSALKSRAEAVAAMEEASLRAQEAAEALTQEHMKRESVEAEARERLDRELARHERERDLLQQQRDQLRSRLSRIVSEQSDLLDQMSDNPTLSAKPVEARPLDTTKDDDVNVIEITGAEMVNTAESEANVQLPQVRPVQTRPPEVRTG
jgi:chromosome segregation ATPase